MDDRWRCICLYYEIFYEKEKIILSKYQKWVKIFITIQIGISKIYYEF